MAKEDGIFSKIGGKLDSFGGSTTDILNKDGNKDVFNKLEAGRKAPKSIAGMAKTNLFEFPAFISSTVPLDFAEAACGLAELTYASYLQMAISLAPVVKLTESGADPFAHWKTDTNNYLECSNLTSTFDACHNEIKTTDGIIYEYNLISISDQTAKVLNEAAEYEPLSEFDHYFQEAATDKKKSTSTPTKMQILNDEGDDAWVDDAKEDPTISPNYMNNEEKYYNTRKAENLHAEDKALRDEGVMSKDYYERKNAEQADNERLELAGKGIHSKDYYDNLYAPENAKMMINEKRAKSAIQAAEILDESKVQKLNSLKPLIMNVQMRVIDDRDNGKGTADTRNFVAGVKVYSRLIPADTLPEVAKYPLEEMNKRTRHVRWKAGELKFFKDILFHIKEKKQTAIDSHDPNRKWYRRLYELAHTTGDSASVGKMTKGKSIFRKRLKDHFLHFGEPRENGQRGFIPNATIMMTKTDVDYIQMETGIDLLNNGKAVSFCKELFLMNLFIIDLDAQTIKMLTPDIHKDFEVHSLASVNKQLAMIDSSSAASREIFKVLNK